LIIADNTKLSLYEVIMSDVDCASDKRDTISYVIINPSYDVKLEPNDIM